MRISERRHLSPEHLTINAVLRRYPAAKQVFESLHIHVGLEGTDWLDEVAWRHGVSPAELIERLEDRTPDICHFA